MIYYNLALVRRIYVADRSLSTGWIRYEPNTTNIIDRIFRNHLYSLNRGSNVYRPSRYFMRNEAIPYYAESNIKEHLSDGEYYDDDTKEIMVHPRVVLEWNNTRTEIYFEKYSEANDYANALIEKYGNNFLSIDRN